MQQLSLSNKHSKNVRAYNKASTTGRLLVALSRSPLLSSPTPSNQIKAEMSLPTLAFQGADEQAAGDRDGRPETFSALFEGSLGRHTRLLLLDDVFKAFLQTNIHQGKHYSFTDLLSTSRKRFFEFKHASIPYLATIDTYAGDDRDWVTLKLCNDAFEYVAKEGLQLSRHNNGTWAWTSLTPEDTMLQFPFMSETVKAQYEAARIYYNFPDKRLQIKLYPRDMSTPGLEVNYESGHPYMDNNAPIGRFP